MKYKVGDKVQIHSWAYIKKHGTKLGDSIKLGPYVFNISMRKYCNKIYTIHTVNRRGGGYELSINGNLDGILHNYPWTSNWFFSEDMMHIAKPSLLRKSFDFNEALL